MDQNSLPPLPSVEDLFAPPTSMSSLLPFLKNVDRFMSVQPLPLSSSTANVPPLPPVSPSVEYNEPCSPIPPQPTSPLVDRFEFQLEGNKTSDSMFNLEKTKSGVTSSEELLQGSPACKKVRFSETAEVAYDSREEGEISDETDEDVRAVTSDKVTELYHKPPSSSRAVHRSEQTRQSASHKRVPTDSPQNATETVQSSGHHHRSHASDVTGRSSHHRHHRVHHSSRSSKDASKSSHRHHHRVGEASASKTERTSLSQKKPAALSDGLKQPDYGKDTSRSSSRHHMSSDRVAGRESAKCKSRSSSCNDGRLDSYSTVDTRKSSVDMDAPYSPGSLDVDHLLDSYLASDVQEAVSHGDKTGSKIDTVNASIPCLGVASDTAQNGESTITNVDDSTTTSILMAVNVENQLFDSDLTSDHQEAISHGSKTSSNIDSVGTSVPCLGLASNTAQNGEITNMNVGNSITTPVLTASNVEDSVMEIDTSDIVSELPATEETKITAVSAAVDGVGQEYEIIDDLESNADEVDDNAAALSDNSEVEFDIGEDETSPDKHVKTQHSQRFRDAARAPRQRRNDFKPFGEGGDDDFEAPVVNNKIVLHERGHDPFDILPEGWLALTHTSGMPVYLHKQLRVCSLSRPYFLGPGSARKHNIPVSAVPCLQYRRALEAESLRANEPQQSLDSARGDANKSTADDAATDDVQSLDNEQKSTTDGHSNSAVSLTASAVQAKVKSVEDHKKLNCLEPLAFREYCKRLFEFKTITVRRFRRWKDRRKHNVQIKKASRPLLLPTTKLITCPLPATKDAHNSKKKEFLLNPAGKSHICVLHEYAQHAVRIQPRYVFEELDNAQTPFSATVLINDIKYGTGYATSKRAAKLEAARITLCILIPEMNKVLKEDENMNLHDLSFFDDVKIEDPRVAELCIKAGQPTPYQVLCDCLKRNFGMGDTKIQMDSKSTKHQKSLFTMRVSKHEATVRCKNKREGKQLAAQAVLQLMHPQLTTWGSLLRLYSKSSEAKETKAEEHSVTELQTKAQPNKAILSKLREEMTKLYTKQDAVKMNVKGKLMFTGPDVQSTELGGVTL